MIYKKILLKDIDSRIDDEEVYLRIYISEDNESVSLRPGLIVCPGGGYSYCSPREAEPVAFRFLSEGFNCFVLNYSVNKTYPSPHIDLAIAINYIKNHEKEFSLISNCLSLVGFSAAGHLVGSFGYLYPEIAEQLNIDENILRPFSLILGYPVTLMNQSTHLTTKDIITGDNESLIKKLDIPSHIDSIYPPTFVWTTEDDQIVPYVNTTSFVDALKKQNVKYEAKIFASGWHGGSVCNRSCYKKEDITSKMKDIRDWASCASDFIFDLIG